MSTVQEVVIAVFMSSSLIAGIFIGSELMVSSIKENTLSGYHCQPITEHKTLEEAKARIEQYQAMVRG